MKQVNAILIDSKNKEVKKIKFDGRYFSIHNFIGEEVECIDSVQTLLDDCIFYEFPQEESTCEHFVSVGGTLYRGNVLITGCGDEESWNEHSWKSKNVQLPLGLVQNEVEFFHESEIELVG